MVPGLGGTVDGGGRVGGEAWDAVETESLGWLAAGGPWDGVYLHMHGAMAVEGRIAAEERFVGGVRRIVGRWPGTSATGMGRPGFPKVAC